MRIVVDVNHPAQVHFFKNFIWEMQREGHEILVTASKKDLTSHLLTKYGFKNRQLGGYGDSLTRKIVNIPIIDYRMYRAVKVFNPDIFLGFGSIRAPQVALALRKPCINFDDDEYSFPYYNAITDTTCGFSGFKRSGSRVVKLNSFKEIAYLHPRYFKPNPSVIESVGISQSDKFCLVRFVSWKAFHDVGRKGLDNKSKIDMIKQLNDKLPVYITSESPLPHELEEYRVPISPENIHDFLSFSSLFVSDSQTMTSEAAILGTPAIRSNSFVGKNDMGNFVELENKYGLIYNCETVKKSLTTAIDILDMTNVKNEWSRKRNVLLGEKIDITSYMKWFVANYPESFCEMKEHPEIQSRFL